MPPVAPVAATPVPVAPMVVSETSDGFSVQNLRFQTGPTTYSAARAEIRGKRMTKEDLTRVLDPASPMGFRERAMALSADEIVIPELKGEGTAGGVRQTATYRDIRIGGVGSGRIATVTAGGGTLGATDGPSPSSGTFTRLETNDVDLGFAASLVDPAPAGSPPDLKTVYGRFALEGLAWRDTTGSSFRIARIAGRDYRARQTADGWGATLGRFATSPAEAKDSPAARNRSMAAAADLLDSFEIGSLEATGFEFADGAKGDTSGRVARVAYSADRGQPGEFRVEGVETNGPDGKVRLTSMAVEGISLKSAIAGMRAVASSGDSEIGPAEARRLIPQIGSVRFGRLEFDDAGTAAGPSKGFSIGSIELATGKPVEGVPTDVRMTFANVVVPLGTVTAQDPTGQLAALGYKALDVTFRTNVGWNEAGQEIVVREISLDGVDMGAVVVRAVLANVSKDLFSPDQALASIAAVGIAAKSVDIGVENRGLVERILQSQAASQGRSVDALRTEIGAYAAIGIPALLGSTPASKTLGQAVARFIAKPGRLTIQLKAKQAPGLGLPDFAGSPDPASLLDKVDLTATAE